MSEEEEKAYLLGQNILGIRVSIDVLSDLTMVNDNADGLIESAIANLYKALEHLNDE